MAKKKCLLPTFVTWRKSGAFPFSQIWGSSFPILHSPCSPVYCTQLYRCYLRLSIWINLWLTFLVPFAVVYCSVRSEVVCGFYLFTQLQCEDYSVKVLRASWVKAGFQFFLQESLQLVDFGRKKGFWFGLWSVVWCCGLLFFFCFSPCRLSGKVLLSHSKY